MIKNLVFDLGNVLIEWNAEKVLQHFEPGEARRQALYDAIFASGIWHKTDTGELNLTEATKAVQASLDASFAETVDKIFHCWYEGVEVYRHLQDKIVIWANQGYKIYILSTTCEIFYAIEAAGHLPMTSVLDGKILSSEVKVTKPHQEIYQILLDQYQLEAQQSVFIDDLQVNLDTAKNLGFETILATSEQENIREMEQLLQEKGAYGL